MKEVALTGSVRKETGKQANKHLRKEGFIPAVVYRHGKTTLSLKVAQKALYQILHTERGENVVISLTVSDDPSKKQDKERLVMIKEIQQEPLHGGILHVDFHEISLTEKLKVNIPIQVKGEPLGVKQDGGVLEYTLREVEAECLPTQIPDFLELEVSSLLIGDSLHVRDLSAPPEVKILSDPELTILIVKPPHVEKVEEVAVEAVTEPEVITERKAAEGEEGPLEEKKAAEKKPVEEPKKKAEVKGE
ncbi:MAG: 50S ribosomal protein L25 [Candidatus Omnitrophota bacterium]